jgi:diguanylate cyclase (GGDEF)-like protein/PAS domain S-box-containing protein
MANTGARVLIVEDVPVDAELMLYELQQARLCGQNLRVSDKAEYIAALRDFAPDVILSDHSLPSFDGQAALALRQQLCPDTPFIIVSGALGEERAVEILKAGATDYVLKHNLARLAPAVSRALSEAQAQRDRRRIAHELESERHLLSTVLGTSAALVALLDQEGRIVRINAAAAEACGVTEAEALGQHYWDLFVPPGDMEVSRAALRQLFGRRRMPEASRAPAPWREVNRLGRVVLWSISFLDEPGLHGETTVLAGLDITEHEAAKERAYVLSYYDSLTHLPNLALFRDRLRLAQMRAGANSRRLVLALIGVGRLRQVRDSLGSRVSDLLLSEAARRLQTLAPSKEERLARIGDDSFALYFEIDAQADLTEGVNTILSLTREPYIVDGRPLVLPGQLGVALYPGDGEDAGSLLQAAESALHRASELDEGGVAYYQAALYDRARERLLLESELRNALAGTDDGGELVLHYQPQVDLRSGRIVGAEALVRWQHPRRGLLSPAQFIGLAEESELIFALGDWVMREVCEQALAWDGDGLGGLRYAINLSARQFSHPDAVERIRDAIEQSGFDPRRLELELTESASMRDPEITIEVMHRLREMGLRLAIDDFGTGYSNLSYLKRFPVHALKLDRVFVKELTTDPDDFAISRAVVAIAHQLHLELVAEGVETRGQLALLADARCDVVQGYLVSAALPPDEFASMMRSDYRLDVGGRQPYRRTLLSIEPEGGETLPLPRWLRENDCEFLRAESIDQAFELLATHEVGVLLSDLRRPTPALGAFLGRVHGMYPEVVCVTLSPEPDAGRESSGPSRRRVLKRSDERRLPAVIQDAFASYEAERGARH